MPKTKTIVLIVLAYFAWKMWSKPAPAPMPPTA